MRGGLPSSDLGGNVGDAEIRFRAGYLDAGGDPALLAHVYDVMECEWTNWRSRPWFAENGYLSIAQFHSDTWARAGGGDPSDLHQVGGNVARWIALVDEGSTAGWPVCWWVG